MLSPAIAGRLMPVIPFATRTHQTGEVSFTCTEAFLPDLTIGIPIEPLHQVQGRRCFDGRNSKTGYTK